MKIDLGLRTDSKIRFIRGEGLPAYKNRVKDRSEESKRLRKLKKIDIASGKLSIGFDPPPVLNVSPFPPAPIRSGSQVHMLDRLAEEKMRRPVALAYPRDDSWWLELWLEEHGGIYPLGDKANLVEMLARGARLVGTNLIHIENILGLPVNLPHGLEKAGMRTIISINDFSLYCRRPHLIDAITGRFCDYCEDADRCQICLREIDPESRYPQQDYRKISAASIYSATALIFPSAFLQRQHLELFPSRSEHQMEQVIAPSTRRPETFVDRSKLHPNIGFVGGVFPHKGGRLIPPVMGRLRAQEKKATGFVFGPGDPELIAQIKQAKGVKVVGYYRPGTLGESLVKNKIAVAVLPSIWPEAYSMVVDECLATGTPVVAFDLGAVGDRLEFWSTGELVHPAQGAAGLAEAVLDTLSGRKIGTDVIRTLPNLGRLVQKYTELYRTIRLRERYKDD